MKLLLVLSTIGRTEEVGRFLASLEAQHGADYELVVVDQNADERLAPVLAPYRDRMPLRHVRSARGLSKGRNVGLDALSGVSGDLVAFPDDDCWYPPGLLARVGAWFEANPGADGVSGISLDEQGRPSAARWDDSPGAIDRWNVWRRAISFSFFLRSNVARTIGGFDESLGVGAGTPWGSGEETDYLLRALEAGFSLRFDPSIAVHHPEPVRAHTGPDARRAYTYGSGMGRVMRKHGYPACFIAYQCLRPIGGASLATLKRDLGHARFYLASARGRLRGSLSSLERP
jgi:glycosyltransferase involved in cell wall biosynthesis